MTHQPITARFHDPMLNCILLTQDRKWLSGEPQPPNDHKITFCVHAQRDELGNPPIQTSPGRARKPQLERVKACSYGRGADNNTGDKEAVQNGLMLLIRTPGHRLKTIETTSTARTQMELYRSLRANSSTQIVGGWGGALLWGSRRQNGASQRVQCFHFAHSWLLHDPREL